MKLLIPLGTKTFDLELNLPEENVVVAQNPLPPEPGSWEELAAAALQKPIGTERISDYNLAGKKVAIIADDRTRPTPAYRLIPAVLAELKKAGVKGKDITFVAAAGEHEAMNQAELEAKFGPDIAANYRVICHDAFDLNKLVFCGFSNLANPIWINNAVTEADFTIAIGRIYLHYNFGYAGGAKMILPGVSGVETITYNHAMFCSPNSGVGHLEEHPARQDAEEIAGIAGLDFILNILINRGGEPIAGFAGDYIAAHRGGVAHGDRYIWGAEIGEKADITIASPGEGEQGWNAFNGVALQMAAAGTKVGGTLILLTNGNNPDSAESPPSDQFQQMLDSLSFAELILEYERRNWDMPRKEFHLQRRKLWSEHHVRRPFFDHDVILTGGKVHNRVLKRYGARNSLSPAEAVNEAIERHGNNARVLVMPKAASTLPLERFH